MSKGSKQRPADISQKEWQKRYEDTFKPTPKQGAQDAEPTE